jgi:hypothetical protein
MRLQSSVSRPMDEKTLASSPEEELAVKHREKG